MSVFSVNPREDNPVTTEVLATVCARLGVEIADDETDDYRRLLAVFHESAEQLMSMPDYEPQVDLSRFPREDVYYPKKEDNTNGAWAWRCTIKDKEGRGGILKGKTVVLKDMISVKDVPMLMGTEFVDGYVPTIDATVVTRILTHGGEVTGKAVCENLCHSGTSHSAASGVVENPYVKGYSAGGSSSGSGVLVALGKADMSIGADQGGSVRIPACNCGIVGFKPTFGLIPYTGCGSNEPTNDHLGPMTRTVKDNAMLLEAIAGSDNIDDRSFAAGPPEKLPKYSAALAALSSPIDLTGFKIGIIAESLTSPVLDQRLKATFLHAAELYRSLGATVTEISIPIHAKGSTIWTAISKVSGYFTKSPGTFGRRGHNMNELNALFSSALGNQQRWDKAYVATKNVFLNGAYAATAFPGLVGKATNLSRQLRDAYDAALEEVDVLLTPTLPYLATSHSAVDARPIEQIEKQVGLTGNTCPFNQTGHPALTLPVGMLEIVEGPAKGTGAKLPVGMQIVGKWWAEETVLKAAFAWETSWDWKTM